MLKKEKKPKKYLDDVYTKTLGNPSYPDDTRRELKVKTKGLEHDYKVLKYETKGEISKLKLILVCMFGLGMILYKTR